MRRFITNQKLGSRRFLHGIGKLVLWGDLSVFNGINGVTGAEDVSPGVSRNSLASHKNTTRPLYVLYAPTNRPIPDSKMVTGCAKCVRRPQAGLRPSGACPSRRSVNPPK
jgi:hypothetical protein